MVGTVGAEVEPTIYVSAQGLCARAGRKVVVSGLDLTFKVGVHGLLGPNGAGKTTLIRTLATVARPAGGDLRLLGRSVGHRGELRQVRRELGYLPQEFGYYRRFTVREFVEYMAWLKEVSNDVLPGAVRHAIDRAGLHDRADDRMHTLSGGMVRRAGIAQAIVNDPRVLFLDEPTAGLDPEQRIQFRTLLRALGENACVVVSTHLVEDVAAACSDVVLMDRGQIVFQGSTAELIAAGDGGDAGDSPAERGYTTLMAAHQQRPELPA